MRTYTKTFAIVSIVVSSIPFALSSRSQSGSPGLSGPTDPGVRAGAPSAGQPITGLTTGELDFFNRIAQPTFTEVDAVANGLGPPFNLDSCAGCPALPTLPGASPTPKPQVAPTPC